MVDFLFQNYRVIRDSNVLGGKFGEALGFFCVFDDWSDGFGNILIKRFVEFL